MQIVLLNFVTAHCSYNCNLQILSRYIFFIVCIIKYYFQGKGFPDIITRLFVKQLSSKLNIPILALVDGNPFGMEIMCVYRFGSCVRIIKNNYLSI